MRKTAVATALVGSNGLFREGLARILGSDRFDVVASTSSLDSVVLTSLRHRRSNLLIIGVDGHPDQTVAQIKLFKELYQTGHVVVLAQHRQREGILAIFRAGADAYLTENVTCEALVKSLELVMLGEIIFPQELLAVLFNHENAAIDAIVKGAVGADEKQPALRDRDIPRLSGQEKRILRCLVDGDSNKVIARKVDIAEATVKVHVKAILRKIRLQNRTQAAVWALNNGPSVFELDDPADESASKHGSELLD